MPPQRNVNYSGAEGYVGQYALGLITDNKKVSMGCSPFFIRAVALCSTLLCAADKLALCCIDFDFITR